MKHFNFSSKGAIPVLIAFFFLFQGTVVRSQVRSSDNVNISFGIQKYDPVHVNANEKKGSSLANPILFTATNSTYYPFMVSVDFIEFVNLSPRPPVREIEVRHGVNNMFSFSAQVPGRSTSYQYSYRYWLAPSAKNMNEEFPYLIPLKEGKEVSSRKTLEGRFDNSFSGNAGDTVYCMRRGLVMAVPRVETIDFRLSDHNSLEVLHDDGTLMIYHNLKRSENFTEVGKIVLPGQAIGTMSDSSYLRVDLIKVANNENLLLSLPIRYATGKGTASSFDEIDGKEKSVHPWDVIKMEMKSRELKMVEKKH